MRSVLLIILVTISIPASAQWWRIDLKLKKKELPHPELIEPAKDHSRARLPGLAVRYPEISPVQFFRSDYSYEAEESIVIKEAQRNMRYRTYADASYNFSDLAHLYIQQNRFSEAKWYLLQSNLISREQSDHKHTISNLIDLATIKVNIGEFILAQTDLAEAHDLANSSGFKEYLAEIENMMLYIKQNRLPTSIPVFRYADMPQNNNKAQ